MRKSPIVVNGTQGQVVDKHGEKLYGMDAELLLKMKDKEDPEVERKTAEWICQVIGEEKGLALSDLVQDSMALVRLMNTIKPGSVQNFNKIDPNSVISNTMPIAENIKLFLNACKSLGVHESFSISDFQKKEYRGLCAVVASLSRTAKNQGLYTGAILGPQLPSPRPRRWHELDSHSSPALGRWTKDPEKLKTQTLEDTKQAGKEEPSQAKPRSKMVSVFLWIFWLILRIPFVTVLVYGWYRLKHIPTESPSFIVRDVLIAKTATLNDLLLQSSENAEIAAHILLGIFLVSFAFLIVKMSFGKRFVQCWIGISFLILSHKAIHSLTPISMEVAKSVMLHPLVADLNQTLDFFCLQSGIVAFAVVELMRYQNGAISLLAVQTLIVQSFLIIVLRVNFSASILTGIAFGILSNFLGHLTALLTRID